MPIPVPTALEMVNAVRFRRRRISSPTRLQRNPQKKKGCNGMAHGAGGRHGGACIEKSPPRGRDLVACQKWSAEGRSHGWAKGTATWTARTQEAAPFPRSTKRHALIIVMSLLPPRFVITGDHGWAPVTADLKLPKSERCRRIGLFSGTGVARARGLWSRERTR